MTGAALVVVIVVGLFAPALSNVLKSFAFRNRAAGKAEMIRAKGESARTHGKPREWKRGRRG